LAPKREKGIELELFRHRGQKLNRAITRVLGAKQPQTTRQIGKNVANLPNQKNTRLSTVNKRVRALKEQGALKTTQTKERVGGITNYYELTSNAYLAMLLNSYSKEDLFEKISEESALIIAADLVFVIGERL
jgi:hypothetical protein